MQAEQALLLVLLVGIILISTTLIRALLHRLAIPDLVGYILLGIVLHSADQQWHYLNDGGRVTLDFLADIGIICLLFRVGLESKLEELIRQLGRASLIWVGDILVSGLVGCMTAYALLNLDVIPSLFVGTAMTATSAGISIAVWKEANAMSSPNGELMLDVAEMDDISAVVLMTLLFSLAPLLQAQTGDLLPAVMVTLRDVCLKFLAFTGFCYFFSRYVERSLTTCFQNLEPPPALTILVVGVSLFTSALAGLIGFSVAIGAFFSGLVFSRDPRAVKIDASFDILYESFVPFFFISLGLQVDWEGGVLALGLGLILFLSALIGKLGGVIPPMLLLGDWSDALLLGISMVPRAEIMMIVMQRGLQLGGWAVPSHVFSAMVLVVGLSTITAPLVLRSLLQKWPQEQISST
jgi:Kef-type K+ transport system membrane component KefB